MSGMFRALQSNEIECRVQSVKANGFVLLLYKDARADMAILDETVGAMGWQRSHSRENANCTVSIYNSATEAWVYKEDTGTKSNTEAEKGMASDSFKRACFNWGIGRELYSSPFIWINQTGYIKNGKVYEKFRVAHLAVENGEITQLAIVDSRGAQVYKYNCQ